ncbi:AAA family ATPase [Sorangium sp. So ce302]|uniref:ATP-dependent nuclease n=1 Tax=Sorangium sp. So ce302 TaxID=3133297 RepID=UPI003F607CB2
MADVRISSVAFDQFKAFARYTISLDRLNVLVGPNNCGKSTILGAFRALATGLRNARAKSPERVELPDGRIQAGYSIREDMLPISLENVHTDYSQMDSNVVFHLSTGSRLRLFFPRNGGCYLLPETRDGAPVSSPAAFRKHFPVSIAVVPVLGPVEHREVRREKETVVAGLNTHRASRHFRNYWYYFRDGFEEFSASVRATWPGMDIQAPEISDRMTGELAMFCLEDRMTRELYWAGFGFQVWCQLLTHLSRSKDDTILIVDEPEVYLHPDVQRQLLGLLKDAGPDVLLATHSTEIMAEADPGDLLLIDKRKHAAERLRDVAGVQRALGAVGSVQNITLTALARNRRVLFVEGDDDFRLIRRFAKRLGLNELAAGMGITSLDSGGFGSWQKITTLAEGIEDALGAKLRIAAVYDRDYFCEEEISHVYSTLSAALALAHVHERKEIENYLLIPAAIDRAAQRAAADRATRTNSTPVALPPAEQVLRDITDGMRDEVQAQLIARRGTYLRNQRKDLSEITRETLAMVSAKWNVLSYRLEIVGGKDVLRALREHYQKLGIALTDARIIDALHREDIPGDLVALLNKLEQYRTASA